MRMPRDHVESAWFWVFAAGLTAMHLFVPSLQMAALAMPGHRSRHCLLTWAALMAQWCSFHRRVLVSECRSASRSMFEVWHSGCDRRDMFAAVFLPKAASHPGS